MARDLSAGEVICKQGEVSTELYVLVSGHLEVCIRDRRGRDKRISEITEPNSIFGEIGAILKQPRSATLRALDHSIVQVIDVKKKSLEDTILAQPRLGLSISLNLAKHIKETNAKLSEYTEFLNEARKVSDDYLMFFYEKAKFFGELFEQTRFAWAKTIYDKSKSHICYGMGEGVSKGQAVGETPAAPPAAAEDTPQAIGGGREFKPGEILCREGEEGREIFILQNGSLEVQIKGRKVAEIKDKGAVIGEVAVLAGYGSRKFELRSATLMARDAATVIVIDGTRLEAVITANPQLILFITKVLSERLPTTNNSYLAADDQIRKYIALLDPTGVTTMTLLNAFELLLTNVQSNAKDKPQAEGMAEEIEAKFYQMKEKARHLMDQFAVLSKK